MDYYNNSHCLYKNYSIFFLNINVIMIQEQNKRLLYAFQEDQKSIIKFDKSFFGDRAEIEALHVYKQKIIGHLYSLYLGNIEEKTVSISCEKHMIFAFQKAVFMRAYITLSSSKFCTVTTLKDGGFCVKIYSNRVRLINFKFKINEKNNIA